MARFFRNKFSAREVWMDLLFDVLGSIPYAAGLYTCLLYTSRCV